MEKAKVRKKYHKARGTQEYDVMEVIHASEDPERARKRTVLLRAGKWARGGGVVRFGKGTMDIMLGQEDLDEWTDEELMLGYRKGSKTRRANVIPIEVHQELQKRVISRAQHMFAAHLELSVDKLTAIVAGIQTRKLKNGQIVAEDVTPVQLKAVEMMIERVMGKPKQEVDVNMTGKPKPYENLLSTAIVPDAAAAVELEKQMQEAEAEIEESS